METRRKPFEGVINIVRFNWHYYVIALLLIVGLLIAGDFLPSIFQLAARAIALALLAIIVISLAVSTFVYDLSGFYSLNWIPVSIKSDETVLNVHAGYDETSYVLKGKFDIKNLKVFDFYNPKQHTEISIKRARKVLAPFPGTQAINTTELPMDDHTAHKVFAIFAAHEIRDTNERIAFFRELSRVLKSDGKIIVAEHLRDIPNFLAYNLGFLHFLSRKEWFYTFDQAGLTVAEEFKITPFVTVFLLNKNGITS